MISTFIQIYPAYASTLGGNNSGALTGSVGIGNVELYADKTTQDIIGQPAAYTPQVSARPIIPT